MYIYAHMIPFACACPHLPCACPRALPLHLPWTHTRGRIAAGHHGASARGCVHAGPARDKGIFSSAGERASRLCGCLVSSGVLEARRFFFLQVVMVPGDLRMKISVSAPHDRDVRADWHFGLPANLQASAVLASRHNSAALRPLQYILVCETFVYYSPAS
jgi:hypothetical protein